MAAAEQRVEVDSEDIESTDFGSTCSDRRVYLILSRDLTSMQHPGKVT